MAIVTKAVRGTQDVLPSDSYKWRIVERIMMEEAQSYGFKEIRTPVFEHTELFNRSVGDTTDIVQKEMYTFNDKGNRSITLRPEGTAGAARAMLEHGLYNEGLPVKLSYLTSCYRYEKPQAGRLREFHQFGASTYVADAELISLGVAIFNRLGVKGITVELNSIGCPECRQKYYDALKEYFNKHKEKLCETCNDRLDRNPMRILDCKSPVCSEIAQEAPVVLDYICDDCKDHFEGVKKYLDAANIEYKVNPSIVRGLDYYTRTVFEFISEEENAQAVCGGGGRYDGLVQELGGQSMPSLGFGLGIERILLTLEKQGVEIPEQLACDLYIVGIGEKAQMKAFNLVKTVRDSSLIAETDIVGRSVKAQMKYANKIGAKFSMVLGDEELEKGIATIKNMSTGAQKQISLGEHFLDEFFEINLEYEMKGNT